MTMSTERVDVVVDESYPGLVKEAYCFRLSGSLKATGSIIIRLPMWLIVGEGIEAGSGIEAGWGIEAGSGIEAGEGIDAGWGIEAGIDYGIYAGLHAKISMKSTYAIISCPKEPKNIVLGEWKKTEAKT
jgi:hypothetical protein